VVDTQGDALNVLLRIYTSSGRLIRALTVQNGRGQIQVPWDGLDAEGQALANGLYLFKVHVNPRGQDGTSDPTQKAETEGRFVIVNPQNP
jgi:flagellar hook assembly protein FlgD